MYLISAEQYKSADVHILKIKQTCEIWPSMKGAGNGMGVKNISGLVLKKFMTFMKQKTLQKNKLMNIKRI